MMRALLEMSFSSSASKRFNCKTCPTRTMKRRKCQTDRYDYDGNDATVFPIIVDEGGSYFGFCPGKANWYPGIVASFKTLVVCCELNKLPYAGSLMDQPNEVVELLSWFAPVYKGMATAQRHGLLSKKDKASLQSGGPKNASNNRRSSVQNNRRR